MLIHVAPHYQAGDKLSLVPRTADFYGDEIEPEHADDLVVSPDHEVDVHNDAGRYWLVGESGVTLGIDLPAGHERKAPAKKPAAKAAKK